MIVLSILLIVLSCLVIWRSSDAFELASDYLGRKLPSGIKGATLNAIASSMPEFLTTLFFLFYLKDADGFAGGLGVSSGSALFNLLIIPALAVLALSRRKSRVRIRLNRLVLLREGSVLLFSQILLLVFLFSGSLTARHGGYLVLLYGAYLLLLFAITKRKGAREPESGNPEISSGMSVPLRILTLHLAPLLYPGKRMSPVRAWILLAVSTGVMTFGTWLLVWGTDRFGEATGIPLIFVAVVLSAAATSVPDTLLSIKDARKGNYDDAVSNALGSNIFDIAFAVGLPVLLYNLFYGDPIALPGELLAFTQEVWVFLFLATAAAVGIMLVGRTLTRGKAVLLLGIYGMFLVFVWTQVGNSSGFGETLADFLTRLANLAGEFLTPD